MAVTTGGGATALGASEAHVGEVAGNMTTITAPEMTRPSDTNAYTAGDVVGDSTTTITLLAFANFARVNNGSGYIVGARLVTDKKSITPRIRVHLFKVTNPTLGGDNAAWQDRYADDANVLGYFDLPAMQTGTDSTNSTQSWTQDLTLRIPYICASATRSIYAALEALDAFTPANGQKFLLTLIGNNN